MGWGSMAHVMEWNGMEWNEWNGTKWNGMEQSPAIKPTLVYPLRNPTFQLPSPIPLALR